MKKLTVECTTGLRSKPDVKFLKNARQPYPVPVGLAYQAYSSEQPASTIIHSTDIVLQILPAFGQQFNHQPYEVSWRTERARLNKQRFR